MNGLVLPPGFEWIYYLIFNYVVAWLLVFISRYVIGTAMTVRVRYPHTHAS